MKYVKSLSSALLTAIALMSYLAVMAPVRAETFDSSVADTRTTLAFTVGTKAAQDWLPAPWKVSPLSKGSFKGANLVVVFIDRLLHQDAKGKPKNGGSYRMAGLVIPAKNPVTGEKSPFVVRIYSPQGGPGPYKNSVKAAVYRKIALDGLNVAPNAGSDEWLIKDSNGGVLKFRMQYQLAVPKRVKKKSKLRSATDPSVSWIYRYEQIVDVVKSIPGGTERVSTYEFKATMAELRKLFDGSEKLIGVAVIPWYTRETFRP